MSETPFFPEPPPLGFPVPLQPKSDQEACEQDDLRAMKEDFARASAREAEYAWIYQRYRPKLLAYARRCLTAIAELEDFVHDVMLGAMRNHLDVRCGRDEDCIESYLMVSMKNRVFDEFEKQARTREGIARYTAFISTIVRHADRTSWRATRRDIEHVVNDLISRLPPRCREVFIERRINEMSPAETAARLGISEKTVSVHLTKAQFLFRKWLAEHGYYSVPEAQGVEKEGTP